MLCAIIRHTIPVNRNPSSSTNCGKPCARATTARARSRPIVVGSSATSTFTTSPTSLKWPSRKLTPSCPHLAVKEKVSTSTQHQALSALLFLYRHVLGHVRKPQRLPVIMTRDDVKTMLASLTGDIWLKASLMYSADLRLMECLRVQDISFSQNEILVRVFKGVKSTMDEMYRSEEGVLYRNHSSPRACCYA